LNVAASNKQKLLLELARKAGSILDMPRIASSPNCKNARTSDRRGWVAVWRYRMRISAGQKAVRDAPRVETVAVPIGKYAEHQFRVLPSSYVMRDKKYFA